MRIKTVHIENFRCLGDVTIAFDKITTFIGPNGAGKSSVLRALDWFFNADAKKSWLVEEDVYSGASEKKILVRVDFDQLTTADRAKLGKYTPPGVDTLSVWRIWQDGSEKITGKALAFAPFETVRSGASATERRKLYATVVADNSDLDLPSWSSDGATMQALEAWERDHAELLTESEVSGTHFFGFQGQGALSGLFDYVLVTADLRASEEAEDSKSSIIGRILEKAVDRSTADAALQALAEKLTRDHAEINSEHFGAQLTTISDELTQEVGAFSSGRAVSVSARDSLYQPQASKFRVKIDDSGHETTIERQGHGFQRSLIIAALKLLARKGSSSTDESVICLAIEEPELFQHPAQARAFATVLRQLAEEDSSGVQVTYATHSPYFLEPKFFSQVRRVTRALDVDETHMAVNIYSATVDDVCARLVGFMDDDSVRRQLDNATIRSLGEALFADRVLVVEGANDHGVIEGYAQRTGNPLSVSNAVVAVVGGKTSVFLSSAILEKLGIPFRVIFDADKGLRSRMSGKLEKDIIAAESAAKADNRSILKFLGATEEDWPKGEGTRYYVFEDRLEEVLALWPEWEVERNRLISAGQGFEGKNSETYRLATIGAAGTPPDVLTQIDNMVRASSF